MKSTLERELEFDVDPGFELPALGGRATERTFTSTYYDTPGRRLLACGITLRRRVEQRAGLWQLKLPSAEGRFELEERGGPGRVPAALLDLLPALLRGGADLEPVARLRTRRQVSTVTRGADRIEVVLDDVTLLDGAKITGKFAELEAEVVRGRGKALAAIGKELRKAGARRTDGTPKLARALAHEEAKAPFEPVDDEPIDRLRSLLVAQYLALLTNDPGVRLGADPEAVHHARVATRRARALLRAAETLVDPVWADPLRAELAGSESSSAPCATSTSSSATWPRRRPRSSVPTRARSGRSAAASGGSAGPLAGCCSRPCQSRATSSFSTHSPPPSMRLRGREPARWRRSPPMPSSAPARR